MQDDLQEELTLRYGPAFAQWVMDRMPNAEPAREPVFFREAA